MLADVLSLTDALTLPLVPELSLQLPPRPNGVMLPVPLVPSDQPELAP
jgi:hypothetical protein